MGNYFTFSLFNNQIKIKQLHNFSQFYLLFVHLIATIFIRTFYVYNNFLGGCNPTPCYNGGNCTIVDGAPHCECPDGYSGDICEISKSQITWW